LISDAEQYSELVRLYGEYGDDELIALGRRVGDLTETAQEALKGELARRRLIVSPEVKQPVVDLSSRAEGEVSLFEFAELAPDDCVWEFAEIDDAEAASAALASAGIRNQVISQATRKFDMRGPRVVVAPDDAERAATVLAQPISEEFRKSEKVGDFEIPTCPGCGAADPLLEEIEPTNKWRCEACDRVWVDS
jgi:hypothetical protein